MYVNPFIAGIFVTIGVELAFIVVYSIQQMHRASSRAVVDVTASPEEVEKLLSYLKEIEEDNKDGENDSD